MSGCDTRDQATFDADVPTKAIADAIAEARRRAEERHERWTRALTADTIRLAVDALLRREGIVPPPHRWADPANAKREPPAVAQAAAHAPRPRYDDDAVESGGEDADEGFAEEIASIAKP